MQPFLPLAGGDTTAGIKAKWGSMQGLTGCPEVDEALSPFARKLKWLWQYGWHEGQLSDETDVVDETAVVDDDVVAYVRGDDVPGDAVRGDDVRGDDVRGNDVRGPQPER